MTVTIQRKKKSPFDTLLLFGAFGLVLAILFVAPLREGLGSAVGFVLNPVIGFGGAYPLLTILLASMVLVVATTAIRHFMVDWVNMARVQEAMRAFQKEFFEARKSNNTFKIKRLEEAQPEIMSLQADMTSEQMKPMAFTMLFVVPIFAWLGTFVLAIAGPAAECGPFIAVPWDATWDLGAYPRDATGTQPGCPEGYSKIGSWITPFAHWIALYSLFSIPAGQFAQKVLKLYEYRNVDLDGDGVKAGAH